MIFDRFHEWDEGLLLDEMAAAAIDENRRLRGRGDRAQTVPAKLDPAQSRAVLAAIREAGRITSRELLRHFPELPAQRLWQYTAALAAAGKINRRRDMDPICYEEIPR